ncbi:UNKNOWN [Stylonychia lemnae]|uniref:Uncharacterized protein n=1 Tax=Stylonychia lemnae TaxID=5949 RepID=A0A078AWL2_STYLE|nr:UNKNOWN [Stylonychia lemnae]|eukprot:CDW86845.1 UNKNOWN [Stylonychia lemnae]
MDMSKLDRYTKFEKSFPFYRTRIDVFEGRVKRFVNAKSTVSIAQLKYSFKDDKKWADLNDPNSQLLDILTSSYFKDPTNDTEINLQFLLLWGILQCAGDNHLKARVFYDVLQDSLQETISANDKDFPENFDKLILLATAMIYEFDHEQNNGPKKDIEAINEDLLENIREEFLDNVYEARAKLGRKEYMEILATKQSWIFDPSKIRAKIDQAIKKD